MNVFYHCTQCFHARDIPVRTAARLPEAVPLARPFMHRYPVKPLWSVAF
jgi:hypothetical protein